MPLTLTGDIGALLALASKLQTYGTEKNIVSVFDDGGYRELLLATLFNLKLHAGRHGDDAYDELLNNYELKTVNLVDTSGKLRKKPGITTCHHVNQDIINRYRRLHSWLIGIFFINQPVAIYEVPAAALEPYLRRWEAELQAKSHLNNPKIRFDDVRSLGIKHYEHKALAANYIDGHLPKGAEVYQDIVTISASDVGASSERQVCVD
ncbi:MAG TPA: hypothetical protein VJP80_04995 [Candidatus Saccharimonadales bacterium]|nr:hypothetical protein [Candidatus Saccharimonadales bacterium]